MSAATKKTNGASRIYISVIIKATLIAGSLDIVSAFLYSYIKRGTHPEKVLQYISKTAFGKSMTSSPVILAITGLAVHFAIALFWTFLFFILYERLKLARLNKILCGIVYGLFVWAMMNMLVLPLWNNRPLKFDPESSIVSSLILIVAIGLPLTIIANRYYSAKDSATLQ